MDQCSGFCSGSEDVARWPYSVSILVKWVSFLGSLHWPVGGADLGVGGVSNVEMLILYELWAGERLALEKAHPRYLRPGRPISVSAVPSGPDIDIWRSCRFVGSLMRSLCNLPGGLPSFVPCAVGADHCRLRHIGLPLGHGNVPRRLFRMSCCSSFGTLKSRLLRYLLVLCPLGIAQHGLLAGSALDNCQYLGMLLASSLVRVMWRVLLGFKLVVRRLPGLVVLDWGGRESD